MLVAELLRTFWENLKVRRAERAVLKDELFVDPNKMNVDNQLKLKGK